MESHHSETHPARLLLKAGSDEKWRQLILSVTPIDEFEKARKQIVDLHADVYDELDQVQDAFSNKSNPRLRDWAIEPYSRIPGYDPHNRVVSLLSLSANIAHRLKFLFSLAVLVGILSSAQWMYSLGKDGFSLLNTVEGIVPLFFMATGIIYLRSLHADTAVHRILGEELRVGNAEVTTRQRSQIVGYGVWNRSLLGQAGLFLIGFFFLLNSLPKLPIVGQWFDDPAGYISTVITENIEVFYHADSLIGVVRQMYRSSQ